VGIDQQYNSIITIITEQGNWIKRDLDLIKSEMKLNNTEYKLKVENLHDVITEHTKQINELYIKHQTCPVTNIEKKLMSLESDRDSIKSYITIIKSKPLKLAFFGTIGFLFGTTIYELINQVKQAIK
jgi:hypothetical protein